MGTKSLADILNDDRRAMRDAVLPPEAYRAVLAGAVEVFHESSIRGAFPVDITGLGPGALESRAIKLIDVAAAQHGMSGTGGTVDRASYAMDDQPFYAIWQNVEVPFREQEASTKGVAGLDLLRDSGRSAAQLVVEKENEMLVAGLGPLKGLTTATGIQTFASAGAWTTAGIAWQDITKALGQLMKKKVPTNQAALLVNPEDLVNLWQTFSNTDTAQLEKLRALLPGGVHSVTNVTKGKAYVYAKNPACVRIRVAQDLSVIPLPRTDEDDRARVRVIAATHFLRPDGICEITSVDA